MFSIFMLKKYNQWMFNIIIEGWKFKKVLFIFICLNNDHFRNGFKKDKHNDNFYYPTFVFIYGV